MRAASTESEKTFNGWSHLVTKFVSNVSKTLQKKKTRTQISIKPSDLCWELARSPLWIGWSTHQRTAIVGSRGRVKGLVVVSNVGYYWFSLIPFGSSFFGIGWRLHEGRSHLTQSQSPPTAVSWYRYLWPNTHAQSDFMRLSFGLRPIQNSNAV